MNMNHVGNAYREEELEKLLKTAVIANVVRKLNNDRGLHQRSEIHDIIDSEVGRLKEFGIEPSLIKLNAADFKSRDVADPVFLLRIRDIRPHIFLINSQFGTLGKLIEFIESLHVRFSRSVVFGEWDMVIVIWSTDQVAENLLSSIESQALYRVQYMIGGKCAYSFGVPINLDKAIVESDFDDLSDSGDDFYISPDSSAFLRRWWEHPEIAATQILAYIGISVSGTTEEVGSEVLLERLTKVPLIHRSILDFYEIEQGRPYHFITKVAVGNVRELDQITDAIGFLRLGRAKFDGATFVIASDHTVPPSLSGTQIGLLEDTPNFDALSEAATSLLARIGPSASTEFNVLPPDRQLLVLSCLMEIAGELHQDPHWDDIRAEELNRIFKDLASGILSYDDVDLTGPAMKLGVCIERYAKHVFRRTVEAVYDKNYSAAQEELRLPTSDFRKLSLGKIHLALRNIAQNKNFEFIWEALDQSNLDLLDRFSSFRNSWAHDGAPAHLFAHGQIESVRRMFTDGLKVCRWLGGSIVSKLESRPSHESERAGLGKRVAQTQADIATVSGRKSGIFLSHSTKDRSLAEKIARGVQALGRDIWYSDWSLDPGDSIVQKVSEALKTNDILVVLLSKSSVSSSWVRRELNSALMEKLTGRAITIIPVLIEKCEIPTIIKDILYIDMTEDYQIGLIELLNSLRSIRP